MKTGFFKKLYDWKKKVMWLDFQLNMMDEPHLLLCSIQKPHQNDKSPTFLLHHLKKSEVYLIYSVVLVSSVQQSDSAVCVYMCVCTCVYWRRKWQPTPVFLPR